MTAEAVSFKLSNLSTDIDSLIRSGQQGRARELLLGLNLQTLQRADAVVFADLARRLNMPKLLTQIMKPIVRPEIPIQPPPTDNEWAMYATGLSRLGVYSEAKSLLDNLEKDQVPEIFLFQAYNFMFQWDLESAVLKLKKYVAVKSLTEYERLVGLVNLAACYIWDNQSISGEEVLTTIWRSSLITTEMQNHKLVFGYTLELAAESAIYQKEYAKAEKLISRAQDFLTGSKSRYEFYIKKWQAILGLLKNPKSTAHLEPLHHIKRESESLGEWEIARDCDFYEALSFRNDELFIRVYNGTKHSSFRKRIKKMYNPSFAIPRSLVLNLHSPEVISKRIFDIAKGCEDGGANALSAHPLPFKLFKLLTEDFYRPVPFGAIAAGLYPDEYFNPVSSTQKVYQVISRLRQFFNENSIPLDIAVNKESYQLIASDSYAIRIVRGRKETSKNEALVERLKLKFEKATFNSREAANLLNTSVRSAQRCLNWAVKEKIITKLNVGRTARYRLK